MNKYYMFYLKDNNQLYAFTNNKKLKKNFIKNRNMKKFILKKVSLTNNEMNTFLKDYINRDIIIFKGKTVDNTYNIIDFEIPLTTKEKLIISQTRSIYRMEKLYSSAWTHPFIFNDKYFKILLDIGYCDIANEIFHDSIFTDNWNHEVGFIPDDFKILLLSIDKNLFIKRRENLYES